MRKLLFVLLMCQFAGCASVPEPQPESPASDASAASAPDDQTMMIPDNALKSAGGYAYVFLKQGTGVKPKHTDAVKVHLRVLNLEGTVVDEDTASLAMAHSTPFIEEMLALMDVGSSIRVWGESKDRIWDIDLLEIDQSFQAPPDAAAPPEDALKLEGIDGVEGVRWRIVEPGHGDNAVSGQALRIQASRWKSDGEILESNRASQGMVVFLNEQNAQLDPIHYAILHQMNEGAHARIWIPAALLESDFDMVEDLWFAQHLARLDTPKDLTAPEDAQHIAEGASLRLLNESAESVLVPSEIAEIELNCWNGATGELVDSSYLRGRHEQMEIKPELGVWFDIMQHIAPGHEFMAWIKATALPESVGMDLVCYGHVFNRITESGTNHSHSDASPDSRPDDQPKDK
ncbi:MAG: hypothetical protein IJM59_12965 [Proteobacteria bacterium]|nr:hypothetical protein [Pseudomonadota bacterium]